MTIYYTDRLTVDLCRANPEAIFVFGDNLIRAGTAGQAIIRKEPNAFGIPTKRYPATTEHSFFHDAKCEQEHVLRALRTLYERVRDRRADVYWPTSGIGTGLAAMPEKSPVIYKNMCDILMTHFKIRNVTK